MGFAESEVMDGAGGTTQFVVGECTDVLLRVTTTVEAGPFAFSLDDGGHNGPWTFDISGATGVEEIEGGSPEGRYRSASSPRAPACLSGESPAQRRRRPKEGLPEEQQLPPPEEQVQWNILLTY